VAPPGLGDGHLRERGQATACRQYETALDRPRFTNHLREFRWYRRSRLWVVPSAGVGMALLLAVATLGVDHLLIDDGAPFPVFTGSPDTVRSILSLIGTSIATLTALVLTIVAVVIQLATQHLSPRAVRTFLQDPQSHLTLGTFVTTFTYALVILQQLNLTHEPDADTVASSSVTLAFLLAVLSIGMFISYVDHIVHQSRVTSIIDRIGNETRRAAEQEYPSAEDGPRQVEGEVPERAPDHVVRAPTHGVILELDVPRLIEASAERGVLLVTVPAVGDFIPRGDRLFEVYGEHDGDDDAFIAPVEIDAERSITQDVPFGFRLLIDIAERGLSSGINDPTTATQVVDQLHDLLRLLGTRPFPNGWHADSGGTPRLVVAQPGWHVYVALAFEEIRHYGRDSVQVLRRLRSAAENLLAELPEDRHGPLERQLSLIDDAIERSFPTDAERDVARHADAQGIGSGGGLRPSAEPGPRGSAPRNPRQR
jgi:uncharacterized membrane protein